MQCGTIASKLQTWRGRRRAVSGWQSGTAAAFMHERSSCADGDGPADSRHVQRLVETRSGVGRGRDAKTDVDGFGEGLTRVGANGFARTTGTGSYHRHVVTGAPCSSIVSACKDKHEATSPSSAPLLACRVSCLSHRHVC